MARNRPLALALRHRMSGMASNFRTLCLRWKGIHRDVQGATTLEWALLLAGFAIPTLLIMAVAYNLMVEHYRMITVVNSLPFP